jgi:Tfp pilus assembly protein PilN
MVWDISLPMPNPNWGAGWQPNANTAPVNPAADDMRRRFFWVAGLAFMLVICLVVVGGTVTV